VSSREDRDRRERKPSGQVRHEPGGRAIWEWAVDSGRHAIDSTSRLLKKLDITGLRLVDDDEKAWEKPAEPAKPIPTFGGAPATDPALRRQSFNPYDSRTPTGRGVARTPPPKGPPRPRITQPPARKPGLLARLFRAVRK
jgi:hypothetical protein